MLARFWGLGPAALFTHPWEQKLEPQREVTEVTDVPEDFIGYSMRLRRIVHGISYDIPLGSIGYSIGYSMGYSLGYTIRFDKIFHTSP